MTDLFQSVMIIVGVVLIAWVVGDMAGGPGKVIAAASEAGRFEFWPKAGAREWLAFATAFLNKLAERPANNLLKGQANEVRETAVDGADLAVK